MTRIFYLTLFSLLVFPLTATAQNKNQDKNKNSTYSVEGRAVNYQDGDVELQGYYVPSMCGDLQDSYPTVMIVHQWKGLGNYEKFRAEMLARQCYNAFAVDMYGAGIRPSSQEEAQAESDKYKNNFDLAKSRMDAAMEKVRTMNGTDERISVIGYCFGGSMALNYARSGAPVDLAASFHGHLDNLAGDYTASDVNAKILVYHGNDDPYVKQDAVTAFENEMAENELTYQMIGFDNAVHSFSELGAGHDNSKGAAYNIHADRLSWSNLSTELANEYSAPEK